MAKAFITYYNLPLINEELTRGKDAGARNTWRTRSQAGYTMRQFTSPSHRLNLFEK